MGQLRIIPSKQGISGQVGAVRVSPNILSPLTEGRQAKAQGLAAVGDAAKSITSGVMDVVSEFQEKQQAAKDQSATSSELRDFRAGFAAQSLDFSSRNDSENFVGEHEKLVETMKKKGMANQFFSKEGKRLYSLAADDMSAAAAISVAGQVHRKEQELMDVQYTVTLDDHIKKNEFDLATEHIQESFTHNIIGVKRRKKDTNELSSRINYSNVATAIQADFKNTDQIVAAAANKNLIPAPDAKRLKAWGNKQHKEITDAQLDEFTAFASKALIENSFSFEQVVTDIDKLVDSGALNKTQGQKWKNKFAADLVEQTSETNLAILQTLGLELRTNKTFNKKAAHNLLMAMKGDITQKDLGTFMALYDRIDAERKKGFKFAEKHLYDKIDDLRKQGVFDHKILDEDDKLTTRSEQFVKAVDKKTAQLIEKAEKKFSVNIGLRSSITRKTPEEQQAEIADIRAKASAAKAAFILGDNKQYVEVMERADVWLKGNPDAKKDEVNAFFSELVSDPDLAAAMREAMK
jgi:hypothetical protein